MFEVLAFTVPGPACLNSAYCGPQEAQYRTTPASGDPYRYIQVRAPLLSPQRPALFADHLRPAALRHVCLLASAD